MIVGGTEEDEWVTHQLAGHAHREEIIVWDEELKMGWPAELRCDNCTAVRYLTRNEAVSKIADQNLKVLSRRPEVPDHSTQVVGSVYGER